MFRSTSARPAVALARAQAPATSALRQRRVDVTGRPQVAESAQVPARGGRRRRDRRSAIDSPQLALSTDPADGASPSVATPSIELTKFE
jgi:hypothetical protein